MRPDLIFDALLTHCDGLALPVSLPEIDFDPPADGKYIEAQVFPNGLAWEGIASGRLDQGLLQLTIVWPKGQGLVKPGRAAAAAAGHFAKGLPLFSGGVKVTMGEAAPAAPIIEPDKLRLPVTIPWVATETDTPITS